MSGLEEGFEGYEDDEGFYTSSDDEQNKEDELCDFNPTEEEVLAVFPRLNHWRSFDRVLQDLCLDSHGRYSYEQLVQKRRNQLFDVLEALHNRGVLLRSIGEKSMSKAQTGFKKEAEHQDEVSGLPLSGIYYKKNPYIDREDEPIELIGGFV